MAIVSKVVYGGDKRLSHTMVPSAVYAGGAPDAAMEEWELRPMRPARSGRALDAAEGIVICTVAGALAWAGMALAVASVLG
jgi:hypothetical protein